MTRHPNGDGMAPLRSGGGGCTGSAEAPEWLRFNPHILTGYRPPSSSLAQCTRSLFAAHNETGNVWTHLLPAALWMAVARDHARIGSAPDLAIAFGCGTMALSMWCSVAYHLYMPCCRTRGGYCCLLKADVVAILAALASTQLVTLLYGYPCFSPATRAGLFLVLYGIAAVAIAGSFALSSIRGRALLCAGFCLARLATTLAVYINTAAVCGTFAAFGHHLLGYAFTFAGGYVNASRLPERWQPGQWDLWGNSHQLMHILMVVAQVCTYRGMCADAAAHAASGCSSMCDAPVT